MWWEKAHVHLWADSTESDSLIEKRMAGQQEEEEEQEKQQHEKGEISLTSWAFRLACNVTHFRIGTRRDTRWRKKLQNVFRGLSFEVNFALEKFNWSSRLHRRLPDSSSYPQRGKDAEQSIQPFTLRDRNRTRRVCLDRSEALPPLSKVAHGHSRAHSRSSRAAGAASTTDGKLNDWKFVTDAASGVDRRCKIAFSHGGFFWNSFQATFINRTFYDWQVGNLRNTCACVIECTNQN